MNRNQRIIVQLIPNGSKYTFWTEDAPNAYGIPNTAEQIANQTATASTLATAIQNALPAVDAS